MTSTRARIKMRRLLTETDNNVKVEMVRAKDTMLTEMKSRAPKDTGELAEAITGFVAKNGLRVEVGFRGKKNKQRHVARFKEFGTKGYSGDAAKKKHGGKALNKTDGKTFFGKTPDIPAQPAEPFIGPTWDAKKPEIVTNVTAAINDAIKKAQQ